jgi:hypothetical protein
LSAKPTNAGRSILRIADNSVLSTDKLFISRIFVGFANKKADKKQKQDDKVFVGFSRQIVCQLVLSA